MSVQVLVVDDSAFMRRRLVEILEEDHGIEVADVAVDGREAVRKTTRIRPDVVLMDVEMPVMNGIEAVRHIMRKLPTPILMFSALTKAGAQATLDALEAGAMDFLPKQLEDIHRDWCSAKQLLRHRVLALARRRSRLRIAAETATGYGHRQGAGANDACEGLGRVQLLVIAASTGGPMALQKILSSLPAATRFPLLLIQHMPGNFTPSFAERLNRASKIEVREAVDGDRLKPGVALLAPGGKQLEVVAGNRILLRESRRGETYQPSADVALTSVAENFHGRVLAMILTGMGADGCRGAAVLKRKGSRIWAQDEASCVVYGMPRAVVEAGLAEKVLSLESIARCSGAG